MIKATGRLQIVLFQLGMDRDLLARLSGLSYMTIHRALNGNPVSMNTARRIAKTVGEEVSDVFTIVKEAEKNEIK